MTTFQVGQRVRLIYGAPYQRFVDDLIGTVIGEAKDNGIWAKAERGPLYEISFPEGRGYLGMGLTRNYADELEPVA